MKNKRCKAEIRIDRGTIRCTLPRGHKEEEHSE